MACVSSLDSVVDLAALESSTRLAVSAAQVAAAAEELHPRENQRGLSWNVGRSQVHTALLFHHNWSFCCAFGGYVAQGYFYELSSSVEEDPMVLITSPLRPEYLHRLPPSVIRPRRSFQKSWSPSGQSVNVLTDRLPRRRPPLSPS